MQQLTQTLLIDYMARCVEVAKTSSLSSKTGALLFSPNGDFIASSNEFEESTIMGFSVHAERRLIEGVLNNCYNIPRNSILVTTIEPCVRKSKRQLIESCTDLIKKSNIGVVIYGLNDHAVMYGSARGESQLKNNDIRVIRERSFEEEIVKLMYGSERVGRTLKGEYYLADKFNQA